MATAIINWFSGIGQINQSESNQEPAQSESTAIDARVSVYPLGENHPLAHLAGYLADEPLWDDFMNAVAEYRQRDDATEDDE